MPTIHTSGANAGEPSTKAADWARAGGQQVAQGVRRMENRMRDWQTSGRAWLALGRNFWREIQTRQGRQRHMLALVALAAGAGLLIGLATGRRREG